MLKSRDDMVALVLDLLGREAGGDADGEDTGRHTRLKTGEGILKDDALRERGIEDLGSTQVAVGIGLGGSKVLGRKDSVEEGLKARHATVDIRHLLLVGRGDNGTLHTMGPDIVDELLDTGEELVMHLGLVGFEKGSNDGLVFERRKIALEDLFQGCTFYYMFKSRYLGMETASHLAPKHGILIFRIEECSIEVKEGHPEGQVCHILHILATKLPRNSETYKHSACKFAFTAEFFTSIVLFFKISVYLCIRLAKAQKRWRSKM